MDKIAIVILNWNGSRMLEQYLPSVMQYSQDEATIYVADNASTDNSLQFLRTSFPQCRIIELDRNWGFAEGYNQALSQIEAEYYLLLNSDVEVTHQWLTPLVELMDAHPEIAACQPKLLSACNHHSFEYAGAAGGMIDCYGYPYCRGRIFSSLEEDGGQYDHLQEIHWATGACLFIRSADYWAVGGLDADFFAHNEEIDLCWRLRLLGRKIYCVPQSVVYHLGGGTLPPSNPRKTYLNFRNNLTMLYKNVDERQLRKVMRIRCLLDYVAAIEMLLLKRNWGDFKAVLKARKDFAQWKSKFADKRRHIQETRKTTDANINSSFSILWQYYIKGHRLFSQLP